MHREANLIRGFIVALSLFIGQSAMADVQSMFGMGISSIGSSGAIRSSKSDLLSNYFTPSALTDYEEVKVAASFLYSVDNFKDIDSVVTDSVKYGASSTKTDNVDTDTPDLNNLLLGLIIPSSRKGKKHGLAAFTTMPFGKFLAVETQSAYYPQYMMYQSDGQRMTASFHFYDDWNESWDYSIGYHMYFATGSTVVTRFPSSSDSQPSSSNVDLKVEVKPAFAPSFSLRKKLKEAQIDFSYIGERDAKLAFNADNSINVFVSPVPIVVDGNSSLYYDPMQIQIGYQKHFAKSSLYLGLEYEKWSDFKSSVMVMDISGANSFEQLNIDRSFKDIYVPRIAWSTGSDDSKWTVGYSYRPSPVKFGLDESNYLDSDRQILGFSYQMTGQKLFGLFDLDYRWGTAFQVHRLNNRYIQKQESDSVGYPGYEIGGEVYSLAVQIETNL